MSLRSTARTGRKRRMSTPDPLENKRHKGSSEGAGLPGGKKRNSTSSRISKPAKARDHQNKGSGPLSKPSPLRQRSTRRTQARLFAQQSSQTQLPEEEKRILKSFAHPHIDDIVFFENAFGFSKPTSVLI